LVRSAVEAFGTNSIVKTGLQTAIIVGWLAGLTSFLALPHGNPSAPVPGCQWPLNSHGAVTCVSHTAYLAAGAAVQRGASGVLAFFFTVHSGIALNELVRRRVLPGSEEGS
jgi:hypothetical protein